jgi:hypothetical protein
MRRRVLTIARSLLFGWAALLAIAYLVERPLLIWSAPWIDVSWLATVHLMFDCVTLAAAGVAAGRFSRAGVFVFAGTLAWWDFGQLVALNVPWMIRLLVDVFRDSRYWDSLIATAVTQALLFGSLFAGGIMRGNRH